MQQVIVRSKYYDLSVVKAFLIGIGYDDEEILLMVGPFVLTIKMYMFKKREKVSKQ